MEQLTVIVFDNPLSAEEFLLVATRLGTEGKVTLRDAVFVTKDGNGHARVHETTDLTPGAGALGGAFWGLLVGTLLLGPAGGLVTGAISAGGGALMGKLVDAGVHDDIVRTVKDDLGPGHTALVLLSEGGENELEAELARFPQARLVGGHLPPDAKAAIDEALRSGETEHAAPVTDQRPTDPWGNPQ
jgi:uncharacterized membrane protein